MEDYLKNLILFAGDAIFTVGKTQCIATWNQGSQDLLGYRADEIIGQPVDMLSPDDNKRLMRAMVIEAMEGDALKNLECELNGKNGKVAVYVTASPIKNEFMDIIGVSIIAKDITDQNRLIQAFIQQEKNHSHLKGLIETLTTLNHHIRNAVASISLKAEVCRQFDHVEEYRELTETCVRQSKRIAAVLESLHQVVVHA
jgi:PAS domain S-box-containing protein